MEQHPIPQNISSYEFRLVGDMTLKQFLQLASGIVLALIIFRLPLPAIFKYPLVLLSILVGITLAFIPFNGRPFSRWITAFIRAIYAPTEFYWIQQTTSNPQTNTAPPAAANIMPISPPPTETPQVIPSPTPASSQPATISSISPLAETPPSPPISPPQPETTTQTAYVKLEPKAATAPTPSFPSSPSTTSTPVFSSTPKAPPTPNPTVLPPVTTPQSRATIPTSTSSTAHPTAQMAPPTQPNILAGLVATQIGMPIENAIVEIIDANTNIPARALRTNRLGQFQIATPLSSGSYQLHTEKDGHIFDDVNVKVAGSIVPAIIIQSKS